MHFAVAPVGSVLPAAALGADFEAVDDLAALAGAAAGGAAAGGAEAAGAAGVADAAGGAAAVGAAAVESAAGLLFDFEAFCTPP
ncbi:MAG TPA: hypothetical protein VNW26_10135 [Steroidobacteraceae bacterium]|nr:hypothetical protein [Steroidobacteraceae bacterium]